MKVVTAEEIREIDQKTIEEIGISSLALMERAGCICAADIAKRFPPQPVLILCGGGNNGGDGLVISRELLNLGFSVRVILLADPARLSQDSLIQYNAASNFGVSIIIAIGIK